LAVNARRRSWGRGEIRVKSVWVLRVCPEWVLILRAEGIGRARWIQELLIVTEDNEEEESGETEFNEEGDNVGPSSSVPCSVAP